ncbi:MAG: hypothetical protein PHY42_06640 [Bacilli bacterium]|nr:hypothetical protein [Bacilli bacterium]
MNAFARYFLQLFQQIWEDIKEWFTGLWETLFKNIYDNFVFYFRILKNNIDGFGFFGWVLFIISTLLILFFLYFAVLRIIYLIKRYVRFQKGEMEKDDLREEIARLNQKVMETITEKNKILAMKVSQLGVNPNESYDTIQAETKEDEPTRFAKLRSVDIRYDGRILESYMMEDEKVPLSDIVKNFVNYSCSRLKLFYDEKIIRLFFSSMATSKVIILEGISGTGKTSLPYAMAKFFKNNAAIVSVQPSWRDRAELLGYLNEFTKKFNETDFLKALYETIYRTDINFIVLDEMNLARIEYYFAEFLSIMEMPDLSEWRIDLVPDIWDSDPKMIINGKINIPQNVWFVGTANKDDSTFTITDKVYDRAMSIEFAAKGEQFNAPDTPPTNMSYEYMNELFTKAVNEYPVSDTLLEKFDKLDNFMIENFKLAFGNRILKQIKTFIPVYVACGGTEIEALDYTLAHKILRKFEALNITFMKNELDSLITEINKTFGKDKFKESINYIKQLQKMV